MVRKEICLGFHSLHPYLFYPDYPIILFFGVSSECFARQTTCSCSKEHFTRHTLLATKTAKETKKTLSYSYAAFNA